VGKCEGAKVGKCEGAGYLYAVDGTSPPYPLSAAGGREGGLILGARFTRRGGLTALRRATGCNLVPGCWNGARWTRWVIEG